MEGSFGLSCRGQFVAVWALAAVAKIDDPKQTWKDCIEYGTDVTDMKQTWKTAQNKVAERRDPNPNWMINTISSEGGRQRY